MRQVPDRNQYMPDRTATSEHDEPLELDRSQTRTNFWILVASQAAVTGYLALRSGFMGALVAGTTGSAIAITFAVTAHRWVAPLTAPLIGRISDASRGGQRRKPFMAAGLLIMGMALLFMGLASSHYWALVLLAATAAIGWSLYRIPRFSATPDLFGQRIWAGMAVSFAVAGALPNLVVQGMVTRTWERSPALSFVFAGSVCGLASWGISAYLREPPSSQSYAAARAASMTVAERAKYIVSHRNLLVLLLAGAFVTVASSPVAPLYVVYAGNVLGVGPKTVAAAAILGGLATLPLIPLTALVCARIDRKAVGIFCAALGILLAVAAYRTSSIVVLTGLGVVTSLIGIAIAVSLGTYLLMVFPRDILAEIAGLWTAVTTVGSIAVSYATSAWIEVTQNWRVIWLPLVVGSAAAGICLLFLELPSRHRRPDLTDLRRSLRKGLAVGISGLDRERSRPHSREPEELEAQF
jgi:Na+/melibiose symporter-like transporter